MEALLTRLPAAAGLWGRAVFQEGRKEGRKFGLQDWCPQGNGFWCDTAKACSFGTLLFLVVSAQSPDWLLLAHGPPMAALLAQAHSVPSATPPERASLFLGPDRALMMPLGLPIGRQGCSYQDQGVWVLNRERVGCPPCRMLHSLGSRSEAMRAAP